MAESIVNTLANYYYAKMVALTCSSKVQLSKNQSTKY